MLVVQIIFNIISPVYNKKKKFSAMSCLKYKHFDNQFRTTIYLGLPYFNWINIP